LRIAREGRKVFFFEKKKQKTFALLSFLLVAADKPSTVTGDWLTQDEDGVVTITACGDAICGEISGVSGFRADGAPPRDSTGASECHLRIIHAMRPNSDGKLAGTITDPRDGDVYQALIWRGVDGSLRLRGYIAIPLLGMTQTWTRFTGTRTADCHFSIQKG
jgi:uncharacterized protein (DUF2147 family)